MWYRPGCNLANIIAASVALAFSLHSHSAALINSNVLCSEQERAFQQKLQHRLGFEIARRSIAGGSLAIEFADECMLSANSGWADTQHRRPMTATTKFLSGSVGKTFVAAMAIGLAHEGALTLDDKVSRWLGEEPWFARVPNAPDITLRMLLEHRSGIPNHVDDPHFQADLDALIAANPQASPSHTQLVSYVLGKPPLFKAGSKFEYADTNYILAGLVIEKATGSTYEEELSRRFLHLLNLVHTVPSNVREIPDLATGYWKPNDNYFHLPGTSAVASGVLRFNPTLEWTGGGVASSSADLARWIGIFYGGCAFPRPYLHDLLPAVTPKTEAAPHQYGLAVSVWHSRVGTVYTHGGSIPGYRAFVAYSPVSHLSFALQSNKDDSIERLAIKLFEEAETFATHGAVPTKLSSCTPVLGQRTDTLGELQ